MLFVLCPVVLIEISGFASYLEGFIPVNIAALIGIVVLILCVVLGVVIWLGIEAKEKDYNFLNTDEFETLYGVDGMVKEKQEGSVSSCFFVLMVNWKNFIRPRWC